MVDQDKPIINLTFSKLDAEEAPQPYVYMTKANKRVTFPDVFAMEADEGEQFLQDMQRLPDSQVLEKWLTKTDFTALKADKLTLRQRMRLMQAVMGYYEGSLGTPGEDKASEN